MFLNVPERAKPVPNDTAPGRLLRTVLLKNRFTFPAGSHNARARARRAVYKEWRAAGAGPASEIK
jgi:hypothetical protein